MIRRIIKINEEKCNGCGLCAKACHEGAIGMINGKAKLLRDDYCDGLGDCLPACPTGAISFEEREALAYDETAVMAAQKLKEAHKTAAEMAKNQKNTDSPVGKKLPCGCPGSMAKSIHRENNDDISTISNDSAAFVPGIPSDFFASKLSQWPVQIKLAPINAPYFQGANLLIAADCTAYAYGNFHNEFIRNRVTLIGCPKLDEGDYAEKLTEIIKTNDIKSVTIARMSVPCCGGIENAVKRALQASGKFIPWQVKVITPEGRVME